jgi:hypothetical protein
MAEIYIPNDQYNGAVNAIAAQTGIDPDEIKIALGEEGNIWPESIRVFLQTQRPYMAADYFGTAIAVQYP